MNYTGQAFAYGNTKIPRTTLIANLTSAEHCPSKKNVGCVSLLDVVTH